jgi:glutaredoxin 3
MINWSINLYSSLIGNIMKYFSPLFQLFYLLLFTTILCAAEVKNDTDFHPLSTGENPINFVKSKIEQHAVMVFARSYGPYNEEAKFLLQEMERNTKTPVEFLDIDLLPGFDPSLIMTGLMDLTGHMKLPSIWIGGKHIGGHADLQQKHAIGELAAMVRMAGQDL